MGITTSARIQNGYFGRLEYNTKAKTSKFIAFGKAVIVDDICEDIENGDVFLELHFDYLGKCKKIKVLRDEIADQAFLKTLARKGGAGSKNNYQTLVDTIILQEEDFENNGYSASPVYNNLGWIYLPNGNSDYDLCYRANHLIGAQNAEYVGDYDVREYGRYTEWKNLIEKQVVGSPVLEVTLIASLAAVPNGIISAQTGIGNPIIHLCYASGKGKSTALALAASTAGKPFDGEVKEIDVNGDTKIFKSIYQSWSSTDNAMVTAQAGNRGVVTVLNELGKSLSPNMTRLIFDLSEGSDKNRLNKDLKSSISEGFTTTFISCGESSLLDRCKSKYEGLAVRVMEINKPVTDSAEQSREIVKVCKNNGGFAAPMIAKYIIDNGGVDFVMDIYNRWVETLQAEIINTPSAERFVEKFAALFMATAEIATDALGIEFDIEGIHDFLCRYDEENGNARDTSASSYNIIIEKCHINKKKFYVRHGKFTATIEPINEAWGRITHKNKALPDGRTLVEEIEIRPSIVEKILSDNGFTNIKTCAEAWTNAGLISRDKDRPTRTRKIEVNSEVTEDVYVFRVFA
ncbi:MAG: DUF927 domain-containing protein [Ruminococcaceae bacterium]|nr:DUF927 domain-containing protein [Oscillospiraceae bacterium]